MKAKELLTNLLSNIMDRRLNKLEEKTNTEFKDLNFTKTSFDSLNEQLKECNKLCVETGDIEYFNIQSDLISEEIKMDKNKTDCVEIKKSRNNMESDYNDKNINGTETNTFDNSNNRKAVTNINNYMNNVNKLMNNTHKIINTSSENKSSSKKSSNYYSTIDEGADTTHKTHSGNNTSRQAQAKTPRKSFTEKDKSKDISKEKSNTTNKTREKGSTVKVTHQSSNDVNRIPEESNNINNIKTMTKNKTVGNLNLNTIKIKNNQINNMHQTTTARNNFANTTGNLFRPTVASGAKSKSKEPNKIREIKNKNILNEMQKNNRGNTPFNRRNSNKEVMTNSGKTGNINKIKKSLNTPSGTDLTVKKEIRISQLEHCLTDRVLSNEESLVKPFVDEPSEPEYEVKNDIETAFTTVINKIEVPKKSLEEYFKEIEGYNIVDKWLK